MSRTISLDTETYYDKECSVKTLAPDKYCRHPMWDCYMVSVCDGEQTWVGEPKDFNWAALEGATVVSHNAHFDRTVYNRLVEQGRVPKVSIPEWHCTANLSSYLCNRRSLDQAVSFLFNQDLSKGMRNWMSGKSWADAIAAGKAEAMLEYARRDAYWCWRIWNDNESRWPAHERKLSELTIRNGMKGIKVNQELLVTYIHACERELIALAELLPWIERGSKPTSPLAMAAECRKEGIPVPPTMTDDEEGYEAWEAVYSLRFGWVKAIRRWRSVTKLLATLKTIKTRIRDDGSVETLLKYFGGHTGRWAGDGGLNFQNLLKEPLLCAGVLVDFRALLVPRGKMIVADLSQIEPRVLAWLTGNQKLLELMRGCSVYDAFARAQFNWTGPDLKKADPERYQMTKIQVLGLGYQCGWKKFIGIAAGYGVELDEERSRNIVETFRGNNSLIVGLWSALDRAFKQSVADKEFVNELPSGRKMTYRNVGQSIRIKTDEETGKTIKERVVVAEVVKSGRLMRMPLYGGLLTENLVQAVARDVFAEHLLSLSDRGWDIPFHVHDEVVLDVPESVTTEEVEAVMSQCPAWLEGCPIGAEAYETPCYTKR